MQRMGKGGPRGHVLVWSQLYCVIIKMGYFTPDSRAEHQGLPRISLCKVLSFWLTLFCWMDDSPSFLAGYMLLQVHCTHGGCFPKDSVKISHFRAKLSFQEILIISQTRVVVCAGTNPSGQGIRSSFFPTTAPMVWACRNICLGCRQRQMHTVKTRAKICRFITKVFLGEKDAFSKIFPEMVLVFSVLCFRLQS